MIHNLNWWKCQPGTMLSVIWVTDLKCENYMCHKEYQQNQSLKFLWNSVFHGICVFNYRMCVQMYFLVSSGQQGASHKYFCLNRWDKHPLGGKSFFLRTILYVMQTVFLQGRLITESLIELHSNLTYCRHLDRKKYDHFNRQTNGNRSEQFLYNDF